MPVTIYPTALQEPLNGVNVIKIAELLIVFVGACNYAYSEYLMVAFSRDYYIAFFHVATKLPAGFTIVRWLFVAI